VTVGIYHTWIGLGMPTEVRSQWRLWSRCLESCYEIQIVSRVKVEMYHATLTPALSRREREKGWSRFSLPSPFTHPTFLSKPLLWLPLKAIEWNRGSVVDSRWDQPAAVSQYIP
jgi:hypothetical protein